MTGEKKMFTSFEPDGHTNNSITFGDNSQGKDNMQRPSSCDSSSNMDNLEYLSSFVSSSNMGVNNSMEIQGSHPSDPNNPPRHALQLKNGAASSPINSSSVDTSNGGHYSEENEKKKGFLGFVQTIAMMMILFNLGLFTSSNSLSSDNPWLKDICSASIIPLISSCLLAAFAALFKESELIDHVGFQIFKALLALQFAHFYIVLFILLRVRAHVSLGVVLSIGISGACFIVLLGVVFTELPKFLRKWTEVMGKKMGCLTLRDPTPSPPGRSLEEINTV